MNSHKVKDDALVSTVWMFKWLQRITENIHQQKQQTKLYSTNDFIIILQCHTTCLFLSNSLCL